MGSKSKWGNFHYDPFLYVTKTWYIAVDFLPLHSHAIVFDMWVWSFIGRWHVSETTSTIIVFRNWVFEGATNDAVNNKNWSSTDEVSRPCDCHTMLHKMICRHTIDCIFIKCY